MSRARAVLSIVVGLGLVLGSGAVAEQARSHRNAEVENDVVYLPDARVMKVLASGYDDLLADYYWLRTITYYGEWRQGDHGIDFFRELANTVVTLDPHFTEAYRLASIVLADDMQSMDEAIALLRRGMRVMPDNWFLPFEAGFLAYTVTFDDAEAYRWFYRSARIPGAPEIPRRFAAFVASRAGDLEVSYELWRYVAETTESPAMKAKAEQYMEELRPAILGFGPPPDWAVRRRALGTPETPDTDALPDTNRTADDDEA